MKAIKAPRCLGFDTAADTTGWLHRLKNRFGMQVGFRFLGRGKTRDKVPNKASWRVPLSKMEVDNFMEADLYISPVQFAARGEEPTIENMREAGKWAADNAMWLGFPEGTTIWCDLEHKVDVPKGRQIEMINVWSEEVVVNAPYRSGQYVTPDMKLNGNELYSTLVYTTAYWKSASYVPLVENRGYQVLQSLEYQVFHEYIQLFRKHLNDINIRIDMDMITVNLMKNGKPAHFYVVGA